MIYLVLLNSAPFWFNLALKLNSESQFSRCFILRASGCDGVSCGFGGVPLVSFLEPGVVTASYMVSLAFHVFHSESHWCLRCFMKHVKRSQNEAP